MAETMRFRSYEEATDYIKNLEDNTISRFTVFKKTKYIGITRVENANFQLKWEEKQGELPIVFDGVPFIIMGKEDRDCSMGPQRKKKKKGNKESKDDHTYGGKTKRKLLQDTKKMGCPMKIKMRMIIRFPGYAIEADSAHYRRASAQKLKTDFDSSTEQEYLVLLKVIGQHENHETGELAGYGQSLESKTIEKIRDLVLVDGLTDIAEIRRQVQAFSMLQHPHIQQSNRRYFPTMQDVRNHVYLALNNKRYSQDDQLNVQHLITAWRKTNPEDFYFFRAASINEDDAVKPLLFAHQTQFQQQMLMKYGKDVVVMDSTYKTSKYEIPLFFLCVLTNVGYMVVATFLVGKESRVHIREALQKIQEWNKNWNPKSFMVDLDQREIGALEDCFKGARVFLCDFHREQAWDRWFNKRENGAHGYKKQTIQYLRQIARSRTEDELNENVMFLQGTEIYKNNSRFRAWIERYWLANNERWVHCFRTTIMNLKVNTTNGIEVHHKVLKEKYLHGKGSSKTLTHLLTEVTQKFIPDSRERYIRENVAARNTSRQYADEVPLFLRERPQRFIKHCMQRIYSGDSFLITESENGFSVQSDSGNMYQVECDTPSCTCEDFHKFYWPCKHLLNVMMKYPAYGWDFLPQQYKDLPVFNTDFHPNDCTPTPDDDNMPVSGARTEGNSTASSRDYLVEVLKELQNDIYIVDDETVSEVHSHLVAALDIIKKKQSVDLPTRPCRKKKRSVFCTGTQNETMEDDKKGEHLPGKSSLPKDNFRKLDAHTCRPHVNFSPYLPDGYIPEQNKEVCNEVEKIWTMKLTEIEPRLIGPYVITAQSIRCINSLLPDEVIDSFIYEMVCRRANDGIYHLNCIAMTAVFEGEEEIHHCLRRLPSLLTFDVIIGAYNQGHCHWCLIIIHPKDRKIVFLNPLGTLQVQEQAIVLKWFKFLKARFDAGLESELPDTWKIDTPKHSKQFDSTSCGVFVLKFAENYLEGRSLDFTWNALDVEKARLSLAVFLLSVSQPRLSVEDEPNVKPDTVIEQEAKDEMEEHDSQEGADKETFSQKKVYNFRQQKPKRKRSSFLYWSPKKRQRKHYCICKKPDDGRKYWCCDGCNKWFHPTCVGKTYEEEEETFFCPSCEGDNCKDNFTEVKHRVSSDDEVGSHSYSKRISGKTALEVYPQVVGHLEEVVSCSDSNCEEKDHKRHHEFCANPLQVVEKQKKKFAFGRYYFAHTTMEELTDKLASDLLYKVPDRKNPVTSLESTMVRYVPKRSFLWKLFTYHKQLAFQYIIYVLRKELLILTAALYYSSPYEKCEEDCMSTEMDSKALFGI